MSNILDKILKDGKSPPKDTKEHVVYLALFECETAGTRYIKVGMSSNLKNRFKNTEHYKITILRKLVCKTRKQAAKVEDSILISSMQWRVRPYWWFSGGTEIRDYSKFKEINALYDEHEQEMIDYNKHKHKI